MVLIACGSARLAKKRIFNSGGIVCIYFHNPSKNLFEKCITWLVKNGFTILNADELINIYQNHSAPPAGAVWISFDDGWKSNITEALPVLTEKKIPATFFISTGPLEREGVFWWSFAEKHKEHLPQKFRDDFELLWKVPEKERSETIGQLIAKVKPDTREAMTIDDVKYISQFDYITVGSHTVNHVITVNCTDSELEHELLESKSKIEEWSGKKVNIFSYPNGDYGEREPGILKKLGYDAAVIVDNRIAYSGDDIYKIPRFSTGDGYFAEELCHMLGVWQSVMKKVKFK